MALVVKVWRAGPLLALLALLVSESVGNRTQSCDARRCDKQIRRVPTPDVRAGDGPALLQDLAQSFRQRLFGDGDAS